MLKKIILNITIIVLMFFLLVFIFNFETKAEVIEINFYSFRADTGPVIKEAVISLNLVDESVDLIKARSNKFNSSNLNKKSLPEARLIIDTIYGSQKIKETPVFISLKDSHDKQQEVLLHLSYQVLPEDSPGNYQEELYLTQMSSGQQTAETKIIFKMEVKPWLSITGQRKSHLVSRLDGGKQSLLSDIPGSIEISGNVPWQLFISCDNEIPYGNLNLILQSPQESGIFIVQEIIPLNEKEVLVAEGESIFRNKDSVVEIPFMLKVEDYTRLKAGRLNFPLCFRIQPRE